jgi:hypothetical protein
LDENLVISILIQARHLAKFDSLLHRQAADVADESPDEGLGESSIVEIQNVLNDIVSEWVLDEVKRVENDLGNELESLRRGSMIDGSLQDTTSVPVSRNLDQVGSDSIVNELIVVGNELVQAFLNDLGMSVGCEDMDYEGLTWLPLRSLMRATTFIDKA